MTATQFNTLLAAGASASLLAAVTVAAHATSVATGAIAPASALAFDQKVSGSEVSISYAYLPSKGYAVIYGSDKEGNPIRQPLGHAELGAGDHRNVSVKVASPPSPGSRLWVSLYEDKDAKPGFDKGADAPFWTGSLPSESSFVVR